MTLKSGTQLGTYEIVSAIGAGGMGQVYRAKDHKLGRDVAIKVLPEEFARDPDRVARFQREAKLLASLNHPNIAAIYGLEESGGTSFLVLELIEGETIESQLQRGPIPVEESIRLALQIVEALGAAHGKGVIHRDLKPANIKVTPDGKVKVLDFGLAKALSEEIQSSNSSQSPTITEAMTRPGVILGTAAYMSPEQAKGKAVDKRADIWAFGCVFYECLTGKKLFEGETVTETLAAVLTRAPEWEKVPAKMRPLLRRCLEKDLNRRFHDAADVRIEIEDAKTEILSPRETPAGPYVTRRRAQLLSTLTLVLGAAITALAFWYLKPPPSQAPAHLSIALPIGDSLYEGKLPLAFSPDGNRIAFVSGRGVLPHLFLRTLDNPEAHLIPGTDGAVGPFFSPDGQWVGFFAQGKLMKVSVHGGALVAICASGPSAGASWGADNTIIFSPSASSSLLRVSADGGTPETFTTLDASKGEISHRYPQFLPGGKAVLFSVFTGMGWDDQHIVLQVLKTDERRTLVRGGHTGRIVPAGYLVYYRAGSLLALPFDLARQEVTSTTPVTIVEGIKESGAVAGEYSFSDTGSLAYIPASPRQFERRLVWVDRNGKIEPLAAPPRNYEEPALSPDGRQIAVPIHSNTIDLWIYDLERGSLTRLSSEGSSQSPVWTPDGKRIAYQATRGGFRNIFWRAADGTGAEEQLTVGKNLQTPVSWSPDGRDLAFEEINPATGNDIFILHLADTASKDAISRDNPKPRRFVEAPIAASPVFSPDGRCLAYASDQSGTFEVYIQPFSGPGRAWQVSTDGGGAPIRWTANGRELFYRLGDKIMAVDIQTETAFTMGKPKLLFENTLELFGMAPDGRRFLVIQPVDPEPAVTQIHVVLNWFEELKQKVLLKKPG
jgi:serine/threonine protein kinase/Tol biopolymer transport system component